MSSDPHESSILHEYIILKQDGDLFRGIETLTSEGLLNVTQPFENMTKALLARYIENHMELELLQKEMYESMDGYPYISESWGIPLYKKNSVLRLKRKDWRIVFISRVDGLSKADFLHEALCYPKKNNEHLEALR